MENLGSYTRRVIPHLTLLALWLALPVAVTAQEATETVYMNHSNITVELGESHAEAVAADPEYGPFVNVRISDSLANVIDAPSAHAGELHNQSTHIWVSGSHLELDFDFGLEYDLKTLHFWNYHGAGYDVDDVHFTFFNGDGEQVGSLEVQSLPGNSTGTDADPLMAEHYDLDFPSNVRYVNAWITGTNQEIDFNNIGFTAVVSVPAGTSAPAAAAAGESPVTGTLRVVSPEESVPTAPSARNAIQVILDASGSMWQQLEGRYRYEIAADVLVNLATDVLPAEVPFALRVFGNRQAHVCRSDLEVALAPLDPTAIASLIAGIEPQPFAGTPLAESILHAKQDLAGADGARTVILITDGEESCDGDVESAIGELRSGGFDVVLNIIGFDFDAADTELARERFREWAELGGGSYFDAENAAELSEALLRSVAPTYEVLDASGEVVARGSVDEQGVELESGVYSVQLLMDPVRLFTDVEVGEGVTTLDISPALR